MKRIYEPDTKKIIDIFGVILSPYGIYMILIKEDSGGACTFSEAAEIGATLIYEDEFLSSHQHHIEKYYYWKGYGKDNPMEKLIDNNESGACGLKKEAPL